MQPPSPASPRPDDSQNDPGSADPASTTPVPDPPVPALSEKRKREDDDHDDNLANGLDEYGIRISRSPEKRKKPTGWDDGTSTKTLSTPTPEHQTPVTGNGLSADQRERLEKAKAFARETTAWIMLQRKAGMPAMTHPVLSASPITFLPAMEARCIAIMSRIYVGSINFELTEVHISAVFGQFGHVKSVSLMMDSLTGKHKGFCFVEYEVPEAAELALSVMNGADLGGRNLKVGRPNNYNHNIGASLAPASPSRIYVANVSEQVSEENVESIFEAFGKITGCSLLPDAVTRKHKGNG
ncbi:Poly(U)-binding-splicing factor puf60 [Thoreauomyces humboldtii]|nr:Poly(U)-binding-splicing factor puf60 [Thoreauomyces humboldtii]